VYRDKERVAQLTDLATQAMSIEMQTPRTLAESIERTRIGAAAIATQPDGIDLHGPFFLVGFDVRPDDARKGANSRHIRLPRRLDYALGYMAGTPSFGMLISEDNERISQLLQEYEEPSELRSAVATLTGVGAPRTIQMLNRLGHADPVDPSPRRNLEALIA
jgi:hypothetical protein